LINIFEDAPNIEAMIDIQEKESIKWINITGATKVGKTEFLVKLAERKRVAIIDLEKGTKVYKGSFVRAYNFDEFRQKIMWLEKNLDTIKPDIIAVDPLSNLTQMIEDDYLHKNNIKNLADVPYGKGWSDTRDILVKVIRRLYRLAPLLITISHIKSRILDESRGNITYMEMDYTGKTKNWIQKEADAHAVFIRSKDADGVPFLKVTFDSSAADTLSFAGSRVKEFYGDISAEDFMNILIEKM